MAKRKSLSKRTRFEVFKRDAYTCQYCGRTPPSVKLCVDHIVPVSDDGDNDMDNLLTSCEDCNSGKSNIPLTAIPESLASSISDKRERLEQIEAYNEFLLERREKTNSQVVKIGTYWLDRQQPSKKGNYTFADNDPRAQSVRTFLKHLPAADLYDAIDIACAKFDPSFNYREADKAFRYFCGICWKRIKEPDNG